MFEDRESAGKRLGERLVDHDLRPDAVFAVPAGGVAVAQPIADRFDADLGLLVAEPIRSPSGDVPLGAVTDTGTAWIDDRVVEAVGVDEEKLAIEKERAFRQATDKHETFDEIDDDPTPEGVVAVVDEGIVSGARMKACTRAVADVDGCFAVSAAPVGASDSVGELRAVADEVVVSETAPSAPLLEQLYGPFDRTVVPEWSE